ncbi:hypothetical protein L1049_020013 [Liquidambar formosana]|uniref:Uncharacterized protein n=1 Tax=Liquidambar formosana TaxID=63359 RepID=A0AAP0X3C5_LIQFO
MVLSAVLLAVLSAVLSAILAPAVRSLWEMVQSAVLSAVLSAILSEFGYLWNYDDNVGNLGQEVQELENLKKDLAMTDVRFLTEQSHVGHVIA